MPLDFEKTLYTQDIKLIVGCDEAGRGCLLGPVFAGAVILPESFYSPLINDSKQLSAKQREEAFELIIKSAIAFGVGSCSPEEIDEMNILNASRVAMERAIESMNHPFDLIITDYMKMPQALKPVISLVHGDSRSLCVAAASILAKVSRDRLCDELDKIYPQYHIAKNRGYGTSSHLEALNEFGPVKGLHRFSYSPVRDSLIKKVDLF